MRSKAIHIWLSLLAVITVVISSCSKKAIVGDCGPIAELLVFGDSNDFNLDTSVINKGKLKNLKKELAEHSKGWDMNNLFAAPLFVNQIRFFHSKCNKLSDKEEYSLLVEFYNLSVDQKFSTDYYNRDIVIDSITTNFKSICRVDSIFASMMGFMMLGPFYGIDVEITDQFNPTDTLLINEGKLILYYDNLSKTACLGFSKSNKKYPKWLIKLDDAYFSNTRFGRVKESILGFEIRLDNGGDGGILYLRPNGDFRFYLLNAF